VIQAIKTLTFKYAREILPTKNLRFGLKIDLD